MGTQELERTREENKLDLTSPSEEVPQSAEEGMSFWEHLEELRKRIIRCIIAALLGMICCFFLSKQIFEYLMLPLYSSLPPKSFMIYTSPYEAFFVYIKTALVAGIFLTTPFSFYQLWLFVKPGLYPHEQRLIIPISVCSAILFVCGGIFGYFVIFPYAYNFFMSFADKHITPLISMKEGFSFAIRVLIAFGVIFELPVVIFFLARLGLITSSMLRKFRKYAIVLAFLVGAILTPPDVITQLLMAGPLIFLYEIGVLIAYIFGRKPKETENGSRISSQDKGN